MGAACGTPHKEIAPPPVTGVSGMLRREGYEPEEVLGEGAFGQVLLVEHQETQNEYACKKLSKEVVNTSWLQTEVSILKACRHPNIVFLREVLSGAASDDHVFLVLELARGGSLMEKIEDEGCLPESYAASVIIQTASALGYLHAKGIVHRDMKPENVLLLGRESRPLVKLCDFGLSKILDSRENRPDAAREDVMKSRVGSHFCALETWD